LGQRGGRKTIEKGMKNSTGEGGEWGKKVGPGVKSVQISGRKVRQASGEWKNHTSTDNVQRCAFKIRDTLEGEEEDKSTGEAAPSLGKISGKGSVEKSLPLRRETTLSKSTQKSREGREEKKN